MFNNQLPINELYSPPIIAPNWRNQAMNIFFTVDYRVARDEATLSLVSAMITGFNAELTSFQPKIAIIATFFAVEVS